MPGSVLTFPVLVADPDVSYAQVSGEAIVRVPEQPIGKRLVIGTVNGQVQTVHGDFAVVATAADTRVTLLDGDATVISKRRSRQQVLKRSGNQAHIRWRRELDGRVGESLAYRKSGDVDKATAWTKASRRYRDASLRDFVADVGRWYGIRVKDIHCIPESMRVDATICYRAPLDEALAIVHNAGLRVHRSNGMYSFCDSDDGFKPPIANVDGSPPSCSVCDRLH